MRKTICLLSVVVMLVAEAGAQLPKCSGECLYTKDKVKIVNEVLTIGQAEGPVKFSIKAPGAMSLNDTGRIEVVLNFEEGWHGYAETTGNLAAGWLPTKVEFEFSDGFEKNGAIILPASVPMGGSEVYEGNEVKFVQPVKYTGRDKDGKRSFMKERTIRATVHYQICDEEKCLPPETQTVAIKIFGC